MRSPCCCDKKDVNNNKDPWMKQEDQKLTDYIRANGEGCWRSLPRAAGLFRHGKSCRFRWMNYLRPGVKQGSFSDDEEDLIIRLHALLGNRWSLIAGRLPGRTDNEVKNYWTSHLRRKLASMGIDPDNHRLVSHSVLPLRRLRRPPPQSPQSQANRSSITPADIDDKVRVSEAGSSPEEMNTCCMLPDLNLELTVSSFPSNANAADADTDEQTKEHLIEDQSKRIPPTLQLFI